MKKILLILSLVSLNGIDCSEHINQKSVEQKVTKEQEEANKMLLDAVKNFDVKKVEEALNAGADINAKNVYGRTPLTWTSYYSNKDIVELLIKAGANVNAKDNDGWTALILASINGLTDIIELLIKAGADVNAKNKNDRTALMMASYYGHIDIVELLIKAGADINIKDKHGKTALTWAELNGMKDIEALLKYWAQYSKEYHDDKEYKTNKFKEHLKEIESGISLYLIDDLGGLTAEYLVSSKTNPTFEDWIEVVYPKMVDEFNALGNKSRPTCSSSSSSSSSSSMPSSSSSSK